MPFIAVVIGIVVIAIDQITKYLIAANLKPSGSIDVISGLFSLVYVENRGVAFGMFSDMRWMFITVTILLMLIIIFFAVKYKPKSKLFYISVGLVIGGGIGNLIDRFIYGYVIDFLSISFFPPVCNFADYCITVGVIMLAIYLFACTDIFKSSKKREINQ